MAQMLVKGGKKFVNDDTQINILHPPDFENKSPA